MNRTIDKYRKRKKPKLKNTITSQLLSQNDIVLSPNQNQTLIINKIELPEELIFSEILTRLPVNSLIRFKLVSKPWNLLISTPKFIKSHLKQTISNQFVPSNCVFIKSAYYFYILNFGAYNTDPDDCFTKKGLISGDNVIFDDNYCCPDGNSVENGLISGKNVDFGEFRLVPDGNIGENSLISGKNVIFDDIDSCPDDNLGKKNIKLGEDVIFNDNDSCPDDILGKKGINSGKNVIFNDDGVNYGLFDGKFGKNVIFDDNGVNCGSKGWGPNGNFSEKGLISVKNLSFYDNGINTFLIGSCNGLVCFGRGSPSNGYDYSFYICNPVMGHFCDVLDPLGNFQWMLMYGFGYVGCKDDYLLFVGGIQRRSSNVFVYVYSSKTKVWRKVGVFSEGEMSIFGGGSGVLVNETLHWDRTQVWTPNVKCVCGFNLVEETFTDVRMPDVLLGNVGHLGFKLCEINDCLGAWIVDGNGVAEIWMLKEYGVFNSWMMVCKFDMVPGLRGFCGWTEDGKVLLQTDDGSLLLADPNQSPTKYKSLVNELGDIEVVSLVRSAISPFF